MKFLMKKKLCSQAGESIVETLVGLLISALALMMLAGALGAAERIITSSEGKIREYYDANYKMVNKTVTRKGNVTFEYMDDKHSLIAEGMPKVDDYVCYGNDVFKTAEVWMYTKK